MGFVGLLVVVVEGGVEVEEEIFDGGDLVVLDDLEVVVLVLEVGELLRELGGVVVDDGVEEVLGVDEGVALVEEDLERAECLEAVRELDLEEEGGGLLRVVRLRGVDDVVVVRVELLLRDGRDGDVEQVEYPLGP